MRILPIDHSPKFPCFIKNISKDFFSEYYFHYGKKYKKQSILHMAMKENKIIKFSVNVRNIKLNLVKVQIT